MILWLSYLHNWISYTGKMTSLYWIRAQVTCAMSQCWPKPMPPHGIYRSQRVSSMTDGFNIETMIYQPHLHAHISSDISHPSLTWFNFDPSMDEWLHPSYIVRWNHWSIPKLQRCSHWSLGYKYLHKNIKRHTAHLTLYLAYPTLNWCNKLSMLKLKWIHQRFFHCNARTGWKKTKNMVNKHQCACPSIVIQALHDLPSNL